MKNEIIYEIVFYIAIIPLGLFLSYLQTEVFNEPDITLIQWSIWIILLTFMFKQMMSEEIK